jgi:hypothetical protein
VKRTGMDILNEDIANNVRRGSVEDLTEMYAALPFEQLQRHAEACLNVLALHGQVRKAYPAASQPVVLKVEGKLPPAEVAKFKREWNKQRALAKDAWRTPVFIGSMDIGGQPYRVYRSPGRAIR